MTFHHYRIGGVNLASQAELPELAPVCLAADEIDLVLRQGTVPQGLADPDAQTEFCHRVGDDFLLFAGDVAHCLIRGGREAVVDVNLAQVSRPIRLGIVHGIAAVLYHQRGLLPIHASAIAVAGGGCVAFTGDCGSGKSTVAASMIKRGYGLVADDVCVLELGSEGTVWAHPSSALVHLEGATLRTVLGSATDSDHSDSQGKYYVLQPENFSTNPLPLRRIYVITADDSVAAGEVQRLDQLAALGYLRTHTYCPRVLDLLGETAVRRNFQDCATLLSGVEVYALGRPAGLQQLSQVLDGLEQDWCNAAADSAMLGQRDR